MSPANLQGWDVRHGEEVGPAREGRLGAGCAVLFSGLPKSQPTSLAVGDLRAGAPKAGWHLLSHSGCSAEGSGWGIGRHTGLCCQFPHMTLSEPLHLRGSRSPHPRPGYGDLEGT